jgi:hypothetical protein
MSSEQAAPHSVDDITPVLRRTSGGFKASDRNRPTRTDRLEYIIDLLAELRHMAEGCDCKTLGVILEIASQEARQQLTAD